MLRIVISCLIGFVVAALGGRILIPVLRRMKAGQSIKEIGPTWHMSKQGTPTMGGLMFIIAVIVAVAALSWQDFAAGKFGGGFVLVFALVFGVIGYIDDYFKVKKHENTGLTAPQKFILQLAAAILFTVLMRNFGYLTPDLYIPFFNVTLSVPWPLYMVFAAFVMVGCVNAVNITDGIDGLASGVTMPVMLFFTVVACWWGHYELGIFSGALLGGLAGFLIYNFHPAKVFMGDTGSLFLGGAVCAAWPLDWISPWCSSWWVLSTLRRLCLILYRLDISKSPTASGSSVWPPSTTIWRWAAGAKSNCSVSSPGSPW